MCHIMACISLSKALNNASIEHAKMWRTWCLIKCLIEFFSVGGVGGGGGNLGYGLCGLWAHRLLCPVDVLPPGELWPRWWWDGPVLVCLSAPPLPFTSTDESEQLLTRPIARGGLGGCGWASHDFLHGPSFPSLQLTCQVPTHHKNSSHLSLRVPFEASCVLQTNYKLASVSVATKHPVRPGVCWWCLSADTDCTLVAPPSCWLQQL